MRNILLVIVALILLSACNKKINVYTVKYENGDYMYEYNLPYPNWIDRATAARLADLEVAEDHQSILKLMDSLINHKKPLGFWCSLYSSAIKNTMPKDSLVPRLLSVQKREPSNLSVYESLGYAYDYLGDFEMAIKYFNDGIKIAPENSKLWYGLGLSFLDNGDTISAIENLQYSLDLAEKNNAVFQITLSKFKLNILRADTIKGAKSNN